jgi:hypothetical protein
MFVDRTELISAIRFLIGNGAEGEMRLTPIQKHGVPMARVSSFGAMDGEIFILQADINTDGGTATDSGYIDDAEAFIFALSKMRVKYVDIRFTAGIYSGEA